MLAWMMSAAVATATAAPASALGDPQDTPAHEKADKSDRPLPAVDPTPNSQRGPSGISEDVAYRINPGDEIEVYVWGDERLQRDIRVLPDGSIAFPLVGTIRAAGRTSTQLENEIAQRLAGQYRGTPPQVTISVRTPSGLTFSVAGKVRAPGTYTPGRYVNLLEAVSLAGGPTDFADVNDIVILRKVNGRETTIKASLGDVLKGKLAPRDLKDGGIPTLQPGDTVIVP